MYAWYMPIPSTDHARLAVSAVVLLAALSLGTDVASVYRFAFGPAKNDAGIATLRARYLSEEGFAQAARDYAQYLQAGRGCVQIATPDAGLDNLVNHWLPRQVFYHGHVNRLTTDPQTRNYLQDNMGMAYLQYARSITKSVPRWRCWWTARPTRISVYTPLSPGVHIGCRCVCRAEG